MKINISQKETNIIINKATLAKISTNSEGNFDRKAKIWKSQILTLNSLNNKKKKLERKKIGEITRKLMEFGYSMESIQFIYDKYKFDTLEKALFLLTKDPDTNIYNHQFLSILTYQKLYGNIHTDINNNELEYYCIICKDLEKFHKKNLDEVNYKKSNNQMNLTDFPLLTKGEIGFDTDVLEIINKKDNDKECSDLISLNKITSTNRTCKTYIKINKDLIEKIKKNFNNKHDLCLICYANELTKYNSYKLKCGHRFCFECYNYYIKDKIENGIVNIKCLMAGCIYIIPDDIVKQFTNQMLFRKYLKFKKNLLYEENLKKNLIPCVHPDCEEWVKYKEGDDINVICNKGHKFCAKCKGRQHKGRRCHLYDKNKIKRDSRIKPCPNCNFLIEKTNDCNKVNCKVCNFVFCWLCLNECGSFHYYIFNFRGCPGMKFSDPKKSRILNNNCFQCIWMTFSFLFTLIFLFLLLGLYIFFGASYELIKIYNNKKNSNDDDSDIESDLSNEYENDIVRNNIINANEVNREEDSNEKRKKWLIYFLLFILGILIQPFFLIYKLLKSLMECYRRFGCWFLMMGNY